jgi:hypothetical protein
VGAAAGLRGRGGAGITVTLTYFTFYITPGRQMGKEGPVAVMVVQPRRLSGRLAIDQAVRPMSIELERPITNDLKRHAADLRRLAACAAVINRRQGQEPTRLRPVFRSLGGAPDHLRIKISPKRNGHAELPLFAALDHFAAGSEIPPRVTPSRIWH